MITNPQYTAIILNRKRAINTSTSMWLLTRELALSNPSISIHYSTEHIHIALVCGEVDEMTIEKHFSKGAATVQLFFREPITKATFERFAKSTSTQAVEQCSPSPVLQQEPVAA